MTVMVKGFGFNLFFLLVCGWAVIRALAWRQDVANFPLFAGGLGVLFAGSQLVISMRDATRKARSGVQDADEEEVLVDIGASHLTGMGIYWLAAVFAAIILFGFPVGLPFVLILLSRYAFGETWVVSLAVGAFALFVTLIIFVDLFGAILPTPLLLQLFG